MVIGQTPEDSPKLGEIPGDSLVLGETLQETPQYLIGPQEETPMYVHGNPRRLLGPR